MAVMAKVGFHHPRQFPSLSPHTLFPLHTQNPLCNFHFHRHCRSIIPLSSWQLHTRRSRNWDSNAETNNFDFEGKDEGSDDSVDQWFDVLEAYIDSIWIFKVFGSFGWTLPIVLSSLLLATGPKSFLIALALPLGQSTLTFALQMFQNRGKIKPKLKNKTKKAGSRAYNNSSRKSKFEEAAEWIGRERARKKKKRYRPQISKDEFSASSGDRSASKYGGWDELDAVTKSSLGSLETVSNEGKGKNGRLSEGEGPLLLRLLVSIFPFLSSWTKVL